MGYEIFHQNRIFSGNREYTLYLPYCFGSNYYTYSPWFEDWFQEIYSKIKDHTVNPEDKCYIIYKFCHHCLHLEGDFAECGVYKGGTAFLIAYTLKNNSIRHSQLHLFDTFTGMPSTADNDPSGHKKGDFGDVSLNAVKNYLQAFPFVRFYPGFIPERFEVVRGLKFAFVNIDVDLYQTSKDCCNFFYDRMVKGGVIIFDDYGCGDRYKFAQKRAVDEFFKDKPESPISLPTGQCIVIKL